MKTYEIDFAGKLLALVNIDGDKVEIVAAMDGGGNPVKVSAITIVEQGKKEPEK